eukprot:GHVU01050001.1.p1 GENE.GHVU01050001.1~~GHVU01050001.1.p1  ORF type:complete len:732 (-),score=40.90 GHVU01050001.1:186-2381(-)
MSDVQQSDLKKGSNATSIAPCVDEHFNCSVCAAAFENEHSYSEHLHRCVDDHDYSSNKKTSARSSKQSSGTTENVLSDDNSNCYHCLICDKLVEDSSIRKHINKQHNLHGEELDITVAKSIMKSSDVAIHEIETKKRKMTEDDRYVEKVFKGSSGRHTNTRDIEAKQCLQPSDVVHQSTGKQSFTCSLCTYSTNYACDLKKHRRRHDLAKYNCELCNMPFIVAGHFQRHLNKVHNIVDNVIPCGTKLQTKATCAQESNSADKIVTVGKSQTGRYSYEVKTADGRNNFFCTLCDFSNTHRGDMMKHLKKHEKAVFQCKICKRPFIVEGMLKNHMQMHKDTSQADVDKASSKATVKVKCQKSHGCDLCPFKTAFKLELRKHMKRHEKGLHKCDLCGMPFMLKGNLLNHFASCHLDIQSAKKGCDNPEVDCIAESHGTSASATKNKSPEDVSLTGKQNMVKKFKCPHCPYAANYRGDVNKHVQKHTKQAYICPSCQMPFILKKNFIKHLKTHDLKKCENIGVKKLLGNVSSIKPTSIDPPDTNTDTIDPPDTNTDRVCITSIIKSADSQQQDVPPVVGGPQENAPNITSCVKGNTSAWSEPVIAKKHLTPSVSPVHGSSLLYRRLTSELTTPSVVSNSVITTNCVTAPVTMQTQVPIMCSTVQTGALNIQTVPQTMTFLLQDGRPIVSHSANVDNSVIIIQNCANRPEIAQIVMETLQYHLQVPSTARQQVKKQ